MVFVKHKEIDEVEELAGLAASLIVTYAVKRCTELVPIDETVVVVVHLPYRQRRLLVRDAVPKELKLLYEVVCADLTVILLVDALERAPQAARKGSERRSGLQVGRRPIGPDRHRWQTASHLSSS